MSFFEKMNESVPEGLRSRLKILLGLEGLETPQQLADFEDTYRPLSSWELYNRSQTISRNRKERYLEYDRMDEYSDIKAALDTYAEEATITNREKDAAVWVVSDNLALAEECNWLLRKLNLAQSAQIYGLGRSLAKYGDDFEQLFYDETGVYYMKFTPPNLIDRIVDEQGRLRGYAITNGGGSQNDNYGNLTPSSQTKAMPWDFVHFKIDGTARDGWGESMLSGSIKVYRVLDQLETALALYRLYRAADRYAFYIDVGNASPDQAYGIVEKWRQSLRKRRWFDNNSDKVDFKKNPIDLNEDYFWPVREGSPSKIERLQGSNNVGDIADIEYHRNKLRFSLGIPAAYFGDSQNGSGGMIDGKASLAQQDMRFARKCERLQKALIGGITKLLQYHLAFKGINPDATRFKVRMEPLSYLMEMQRMEAMQTRVVILQGLVTVGQQLGFDPMAWSEFCVKHVLNLSDDEMQEFFEGQQEAMGQNMEQQAAFQQQQQGMQLFNNAKKGAVAAAKTPGGNSGATVGIKKPSAKGPKSQAEGVAQFHKALVEGALLNGDLSESMTIEEEEQFIKNCAAYLKRNPELLEEFQGSVLDILN